MRSDSKDKTWEDTPMRRIALATTMLFALGAAAQAADVVKIGNLTQLSGPDRAAPAPRPSAASISRSRSSATRSAACRCVTIVVDDKTNPAEAVNGASKLIDEPRSTSSPGSAPRTRSSPYSSRSSTPTSSWSARSPGRANLPARNVSQNGFFVSFTNDDWPAAVGKYMTKQGPEEGVLHRRRLSGRQRARRAPR